MSITAIKQLTELIKDNYESMKLDTNNNFSSNFWNTMNSYKKANIITLDRLKNFRNTHFHERLSYGLDDEENFFATLENYFLILDKYPKSLVDQLIEVNIGNPKYYKINENKINNNELFIINFLFQILKYLNNENNIILEIGGGFGSLVSKIKKLKPNTKIIVVYLPESLNLQIYYIKSLYPDSKILLYEEFNNKLLNVDHLDINSFFKEVDFIFLPPNSLNKLKKFGRFVNIFINTRSFQEMDIEMIKKYFEFIENAIVEGGIFYNSNKYNKFINNKNVRFSEYPYSDNWDCLSSAQSFNQANVHELCTKYNSSTQEKISLILQKIKKENLKNNNNFIFTKFLLRKLLNIIIFFIPRKILFKILKMYI
jgi:putative sugar O-methyltransferase